MNTMLVTGGAGFIGSNFVRWMLEHSDVRIVNFDALTYAGNLENLTDVEKNSRYTFVNGTICDATDVRTVCADSHIDTIVNFAAESHVDRSIRDAAPFIATNIAGVQILLDVTRELGLQRMLHVSTDEVYGSLAEPVTADESAPLHPGSPYAASKASADLLCMASVKTHGVPVMISRCSNNYGPYQHPEKLIPMALSRARSGKSIPVYGDGLQQRDWLHVHDHCAALQLILDQGVSGEIYNIATGVRRTNLAVLNELLVLNEAPLDLLTLGADRPGHDRRYAPSAAKIQQELHWSPRIGFEEGMRSTVEWYRSHTAWTERIVSGAYRAYFEEQYSLKK